MQPNIAHEQFRPDIVVEVTMACDLKCKGCYAPTFFQDHPGKRTAAFVSPEVFGQAVDSILTANEEAQVTSISVRGGEPTLHPRIDFILALLRPLTSFLYLETNGNWILAKNEALLRLCAELKVTVKISFDSMHSLSAVDLCRMCGILDKSGIEWIVAITEFTDAEFEATKTLCPWIPAEQILFQQKVSHQNELMRPRLGVIHPDGHVSKQLTSKRSFSSFVRSIELSSAL